MWTQKDMRHPIRNWLRLVDQNGMFWWNKVMKPYLIRHHGKEYVDNLVAEMRKESELMKARMR